MEHLKWKASEDMSSRKKVVITHRIHDQVQALLAAETEVCVNQSMESWPEEKLLVLASDADALMVFMPDTIDEAFLLQCPRLRVVGAALNGPDNIDVDACSRHGIWVAIAPDLLSQPTAELAVSLTLGLIRNIAPGDRVVRSGSFKGWQPHVYGSSLSGNTVGILGMGRVGQAFARMLTGFNARMIYYDPTPLSPVQEAMMGIGRVTFEQLMERSDFLVLMAPLNKSTFHIINASSLAKMKAGAYLINVGRGSLVDEAAVAQVLEAGQLAGYAADVFAMEDLSISDPTQHINRSLLDNTARTLFTPHLGSAVARVRLAVELAIARNILQGLRGERPTDAMNAPALHTTGVTPGSV